MSSNLSPELILPGGSLKKAKSAILYGADAVYFGADKFSARASAENLSSEEMSELVAFCKIKKAKCYLALNTLIKDSEIREAMGLAARAWTLGVDGIIIQDIGLGKALIDLIPGIRIHASTQMTCHNIEGARLLGELGFKRIVLARELSVKEVSEISSEMKDRGVETEVFVHGALCFSYSGLCLFSSFAFNKSGNRGRCLQPCRMGYILKDEDEKVLKQGYLLCPKDQMTIENIPKIINAGVSALKVEGRLKNEDYVKAAAVAYRAAIKKFLGKGEGPSETELRNLAASFLRENDKGYLLGEEGSSRIAKSPSHKGLKAAEVIGIERGLYKVKVSAQIKEHDKLSMIKGEKIRNFEVKRIFVGKKEVKHIFQGQVVHLLLSGNAKLELGESLFVSHPDPISAPKEKKMPYSLRIIAKKGEPLCAEAYLGEDCIKLTEGDALEESRTAPTKPEWLKKFAKEDDLFFPVAKTWCEIEGSPFVPSSVARVLAEKCLVAMRKKILESCEKKLPEDFGSRVKEYYDTKGGKANKQTERIFEIREEQLKSGEIDPKELKGTIICSASGKNEINRLKKELAHCKVIIKSPEIETKGDIGAFIKASSDLPVVASNLGVLWALKREGREFWAGRELNCLNSLSIKALIDLGAKVVVPSVELNLNAIRNSSFKGILAPLGVFRPQLMVSAAYGKSLADGSYILSGRKGFDYPVKVKDGLFRLYNPTMVDMGGELSKLQGCFGIIADVSTEKSGISRMLSDFKADERGNERSAGHYKREIE